MRLSTMVFLSTLFFSPLASATTIYLSDGNVVQGNIIKQDSKSIQLNVDGVTMTYYADEIKNVDGKPFGVPPPKVTVPIEIVTSPASAPAPIVEAGGIDPVKKDLILKFIDVFGTRQALTNSFEQMLNKIEQEKPQEAANIRQRVKIDEIIERLIPVYDRNFTTDDLNSFIAFYGSPEGQKLINTIPDLMNESVIESIKYMHEKFPEVK